MQKLRTLAPTIVDAVKAVERGCIKIQNDPQFRPRMWSWLSIAGELCFGCLATSTLMHLTNKTGRDIVQSLSKGSALSEEIGNQSRALVFDIDQQSFADCTDFYWFESAIDSLRRSDLWPLLHYYNLQDHTNAREALTWLVQNQPDEQQGEITKIDLEYYADFLRNVLIPKIEQWFPAD